MDTQKENKASLVPDNDKRRADSWLIYSLLAGLVFLIAGAGAFFLLAGQEQLSGRLFMLPVILILIVVLGIVFAAVALKRKEKHEVDYYVFFIMGIVWLPLGIASDNAAFWIMGLMMMLIGLANKDKWKTRRTWADFTRGEKQLKIVIMLLLGVLALAGVAFYYLFEK